MTSSKSIAARWLLIGVLVGAIGGGSWYLLLDWVDHTDTGRALSRDLAISTYRERFRAKPDPKEAERLGRPLARQGAWVIIGFVLAGGLYTLVGFKHPANATDGTLPANGMKNRRIACGVSIGAMLLVMVLATLWAPAAP
jgi:hypothetical protein